MSEGKSGFVVAFAACALSGGFVGLLMGWIIWH